MAIDYPTSLDNFPNPQSTDLLDNSSPTLDHWTQHANINDAVEALEAKVGVDGSAVTTSFDYKLGEVTSTDKAVGKTATQTLTNKTLTSPKVNVGSDATADMYYRGADGTLTRIPIGSSTQILTSDGSVPSWQNNAAGADASTTVKGVVELATYSETVSRTTTGSTGAKLVPTPDTLTTVLTYDYQADSVGTDSYAITCTPAPTAYTTGMRFTFKAGTANTGVCSLNVNSLGAKTIKKNVNVDLSTGDILANQIVEVVYDGTNFQMVSIQQPRPFYNAGNTSYDLSTASGTQNIAHGLGVVPRFIKISYLYSRSNQQLGSSTPNFFNGMGTYNGSTYTNVFTGSDSGSTGSNYYSVFQNTTSIVTYTAGSVGTDVKQVATVSSLDSTNITLSWTKTNTPTGTLIMMWEAYA